MEKFPYALLGILVPVFLTASSSCSSDRDDVVISSAAGAAGAAGSTFRSAGVAGNTSTESKSAGGAGGTAAGHSVGGSAGAGGHAPRDVVKVIARDDTCAACVRGMKKTLPGDKAPLECSQIISQCEKKPNDCDDTLDCVESGGVGIFPDHLPRTGITIKRSCALISCSWQFRRGEPVARQLLTCMADECQEACGVSQENLSASPSLNVAVCAQ